MKLITYRYAGAECIGALNAAAFLAGYLMTKKA